MVFEIQEDMEDLEHLNVEIGLGKEVLNAYFRNEHVSISADENKELEYEITDEISEQFKKKYPKTCPQFLRKIYKN